MLFYTGIRRQNNNRKTMTNIENNQNIIIEGVYLPYNINDLGTKYISKIIFCKICFSQEYIKKYLSNKIIKVLLNIEDMILDIQLKNI